MPAYNAAQTLAAAIASVQSQSFEDWELIVVDDGSTDTTREIAEDLARSDLRITVVSQSNAGCGAARNTAIQHAAGQWIVRFDSDDLLEPGFLERFEAAKSNMAAQRNVMLVRPAENRVDDGVVHLPLLRLHGMPFERILRHGGVEVLEMFKDVRAEDLVEVILGKGPRMHVEIPQLVAANQQLQLTQSCAGGDRACLPCRTGSACRIPG